MDKNIKAQWAEVVEQLESKTVSSNTRGHEVTSSHKDFILHKLITNCLKDTEKGPNKGPPKVVKGFIGEIWWQVIDKRSAVWA